MPKAVGKDHRLTFGRGGRELEAVIKGLILVLVRREVVPRWKREQSGPTNLSFVSKTLLTESVRSV